MNQPNRACVRWMTFCFLAVLLVSEAFAQKKIHVVIAVDGEAGLGVSMDKDYDKMVQVFQRNVPASQLALVGMDRGSISPATIKAAIGRMNPGRSDTLVFYYSGHGAYDTRKNEQYLQTSGGDIYRSDIYRAMDARGPNFAVVLTDCCNVDPEEKTTKDRSAAAYSKSLPPAQISPVMEALFLKPAGLCDITSSKPGEFSFVDNASSGGFKLNRGSCFTFPLVQLLNDKKSDGNYTWDKLVEDLTPKVQAAFNEGFPQGFKGVVGGQQVVQLKQTVHIWRLPRKGVPRFGVRAVQTSSGVKVTELLAGAPGDRAGLSVGDMIIEINGRAIRTEAEYSAAIDESNLHMEVKVKTTSGNTVSKPVRLSY